MMNPACVLTEAFLFPRSDLRHKTTQQRHVSAVLPPTGQEDERSLICQILIYSVLWSSLL